MPHIISIVCQKGGPGKTTLAINLADAFQSAGLKVALVDSDKQQTAKRWGEHAVSLELPVPTVHTCIGAGMRQAVSDIRDVYDVVIIDTPGSFDANEPRTAVGLADLVIVPVEPGMTNLWALGDINEWLKDAREFRPELPIRYLLNKVEGRTVASQSTLDLLPELPFPAFKTLVPKLSAFDHALAAGKGVVSHAPGSSAASAIADVAEEMMALLVPHARPTTTVPKARASKKAAKEGRA